MRGRITLRVAHELGVAGTVRHGEPPPAVYGGDGQPLDAHPVKPLSPHLVAERRAGWTLMYFGGAKDLKFLRSDLSEKTLVFEYNLSVFRGREYLKGFRAGGAARGRRGVPRPESV